MFHALSSDLGLAVTAKGALNTENFLAQVYFP